MGSWGKKSMQCCVIFPSTYPQHSTEQTKKAWRASEELFKWTVTMNFLLPPPLAGISKLPSSWTKVTEDSLLQKNVVSRKLAVLSSVLNKWNLARVRPVKTIKGTLYLERQGGFSHMLKPNRLQTSSGSAVSRSVNLLWAPVQFFLLQQTQFSNF